MSRIQTYSVGIRLQAFDPKCKIWRQWDRKMSAFLTHFAGVAKARAGAHPASKKISALKSLILLR
ncbi:MAG: hypothetical protein MI755_10640, partial [Sphingomonadales bacterium]|nr:hypothetical protein [Sphingomonadales bacterium]